MNILMLCLGNICRSPMAEGILRHKAEQNSWPIHIDSAGTGDWHVGENPDTRAIRFMASKNIDISRLVARQIAEEDFYAFDWILAMDTENFKEAKKMMPPGAKARLELALNLPHPGSNRSVPDPYFGGMDGFELVYELLWDALDLKYLPGT
jgi:protein-tyrosine phosphatase